ncbi:MAG: hypothetical protein IT368_10410 [Candidatus Hydrogenedentes bacterium]|nr:hypothetical protein [Candidatus Hydrogenedentota bacterium]
MKRMLRVFLLTLLALIIVPALLFGLLVGWYYVRPNTANIHPTVRNWEIYPVVADGMHNSNTDLIRWKDAFWLIHASSPWHLGSKECKLVLWRSEDAHHWEQVTTISAPDSDIRDPKFMSLGDRLFLYVLLNDGTMATPESTSMCSSEDGRTWTAIREIEPKGWLFWRPKSFDGKTWYCPAYWHEHGRSILLKSTDGEHWTEVSEIYSGEANDETAIEFYPDGRMIATARLEGEADTIFGHPDACTLIAVAQPPYTDWQRTKSFVTRLDGPRLFPYNGEIYAVARHNPEPRRFPSQPASIFAKKRTALYRVEPERLIYLSDLPSAGDTSYAGVAIDGNIAWTCYYTSDIRHDYVWGLGMLLSSDIYMAGVKLPDLERLGRE